MFLSYPAKEAHPSLRAFLGQYKSVFRSVALPAETAGLKERPAINVKEVLVEVPAEKQGIPPNKMAVRVTKARAPAEMQASPMRVAKVFQACGLNEDPGKRAWYYKDANNQPMGPLTNREMDVLLAQGKVDSNTRVALDSLDKFVKIEKIQKIVQSQQQQTEPGDKKQQQQLSSPQKELAPVQVLRQKEVKRDHPIMEPFRRSGLTDNFEQKVWFYKHATGNEVLGPLSAWEMDSLWVTMVLTEESKIAFESTNKFVKMEKILKLAEGQIKRLQEEEERRRKAEEEEKQLQEQREREERERNALDIDYSRVPQMEIGDWGNDTRQGKVKVNVVKVVQPAKRDAGKLKSRRGEDTVVGHKNLNKSMQVEGHYGNLYDKQGPSAVASKGRGDQRKDGQFEQKKLLVQIEEEYVEKQQEQKQKVVTKQEEKQKPVEKQEDKQKVVEEKPKAADKSKPEEKKRQEEKPKPEEKKQPEVEKVEKVAEAVKVVEEPKQPAVEEWQEVTGQRSGKKKQKNKNQGVSIPGFDPKVQQRGQAKKEVKPVVVVVNPSSQTQQQQPKVDQDDDDDGWLEVTGKK